MERFLYVDGPLVGRAFEEKGDIFFARTNSPSTRMSIYFRSSIVSGIIFAK